MNREKGEKFAQLLTEAIYAVKRREGKKIEVIQDELMYAIGREKGNPVEYWRKGNIPTEQQEFAKLAEVLLKRGNLSREWLASFWQCTDFIGLQEFVRGAFSSQSELFVRSKPYMSLVGREKQVAMIFACFDKHPDRNIVAIDGMGGIGKTALALEVVDRGLADKNFDAVLWISDEIWPKPQGKLQGISPELVINELGTKLGFRDFSLLPLSTKLSRLKTALSAEKFLVVVDNLERSGSQQEQIVATLNAVLSKHSKALLMSRKRFAEDVYHVHLQGLAGDYSTDFIRQEFSTRGISRLDGAPDSLLIKFAENTGGSPLALKLVVGQLSRHNADVVLSCLRHVRLANQDSQDEYTRLYHHIFLPSWELLTLEAKRLLVSMSHFSSGHGGTFDAIQAINDLSINKVAGRLDELWKFAFVEIGDSPLNQTRYYLHALTQYFILSDIVKTL